MSTFKKPQTNYQHQIARAIQSGVIIHCQKTKIAQSGGRQWVTVGPYRTAVKSSYRYAMFIGVERLEFADALSAAKEFISWCGREMAWDAAVRYSYQARENGSKFNLQFKS